MKEFALIFGKEAAPKLRSGSYADGMAVLESWEQFGGRISFGKPCLSRTKPARGAIWFGKRLFPVQNRPSFLYGRCFRRPSVQKSALSCTAWVLVREEEGVECGLWQCRWGAVEDGRLRVLM